MRRPLAHIVIAGCLVLSSAPVTQAAGWTADLEGKTCASDFWQALRVGWGWLWSDPAPDGGRLESAAQEEGPCSDPVGASCVVPTSNGESPQDGPISDPWG